MYKFEIDLNSRDSTFEKLSDEDFCTRLREMFGEYPPVGNMSARNLILVDSYSVYPKRGFIRNFFIHFIRKLDIRDDDFLLCSAGVDTSIILDLFIRMGNLNRVYVTGKVALDKIFGVKTFPEVKYPIEVLTTVRPLNEDIVFHIYPSYCSWDKKKGDINGIRSTRN